MRVLLFALVAMMLVPVGMSPAAAGGVSFRTHARHAGVLFRQNHHIRRFSDFDRFDRFSSFNRFNNFNRGRSLGLAGGPSFGFAGDGFFGVSTDGIANPGYVVIAAPTSSPGPAAISRSVTEERPTVETTASGVTIIRGPGSHHLTR